MNQLDQYKNNKNDLIKCTYSYTINFSFEHAYAKKLMGHDDLKHSIDRSRKT